MIRTAITRIQTLVDDGQLFEAEQSAQSLVAEHPECVEGWMVLTLCAQRLRHFRLMRDAAARGIQARPGNASLLFKYIEALLFCGQGDDALRELNKVENDNDNNADCLTRIAELYGEAGEHRKRLRCAQRAMVLQPASQHLLANVAAAETACGLMDNAESHLDELVRRYPRDHGAYYRRSTLRRQTPERNHIETLKWRLHNVSPASPDEVPLCYALAKECEDLGMHDAAFQYLKQGADQRRRQLSYDVADDERAMVAIADSFSRSMLNSAAQGSDNGHAIFVMGLPRSGTTLVDRILCSHSQVQSLGEINDLAYAIVRLAHESSDHALNKIELIQHSARLDYHLVGDEYMRSAAGHGLQKPMFIDKTPWNFLYLGLIALSLPNAKIIHVRRHSVDSCFALYKTLFRDGSPYSYDLNDIARYYIAYHQLMQHWRNCLPGKFFEMQYEELVQSPQHSIERLLEYVGVGFESACMAFHLNPEPAATASAAQVREPIHTRSVAGWKRHEVPLRPLIDMLHQAGIEV